MTDPIARLRALAQNINAMLDMAKDWRDPSRKTIVGIDSDHFLREIDQVCLDLSRRTIRVEMDITT